MLDFENTDEKWLWLIAVLFVAQPIFMIVKLVRHRRFYAGLPSPSHSLFWGNLRVLDERMKQYPPNAYPHALMSGIIEDYGFRGLYYMDTYPFTEPMVFIIDPSVEIQTQRFLRHPVANTFLRGLAGTKSLFSTKGAEWQAQRSWFSPAFSSSNISSLVAGMAEEVLVFKEKLTELAVSGKTFSMLEVVTPLTVDIIVRSVCDTRLQSQIQHSELAQRFHSVISWLSAEYDGIIKRLVGPVMMDWYTLKLNRIVKRVIKERYAVSADDKPKKIILDLALQGYQKEHGKEANAKPVTSNDEFMQIALDNTKTFIAGGHDTTAGMITYAYHLLATHPKILERVRQEHDTVFGPTFQATLDTLLSDPHILSKLPLTLAVFKETLRLYPVGFIAKKAPPGATVTFEGRSYPVDNHRVIILSAAMQRDGQYWSNPTEFEPDRFLAPLDRAQNDAYMPFSKGPQNCIGRQLALTEAQVVMVLTIRYFDFETMYSKDAPAIPGWGGKAYQELKLGAKAKDGIPMRVTLRGGGG